MSDGNWISIKEQKPSDGDEVIVLWWGEPRIAVVSALVNGGIAFDLNFEPVDEFEWSSMTKHENQIEYWQPLPSPPDQ